MFPYDELFNFLILVSFVFILLLLYWTSTDLDVVEVSPDADAIVDPDQFNNFILFITSATIFFYLCLLLMHFIDFPSKSAVLIFEIITGFLLLFLVILNIYFYYKYRLKQTIGIIFLIILITLIYIIKITLKRTKRDK